MKGTPFKLKQKLKPEAAKRKAVRDLAMANERAPLRAQSQKARRAAIKAGRDISGMDHDHYTNKFVSSSKNRGGMNPIKKGTKNE